MHTGGVLQGRRGMYSPGFRASIDFTLMHEFLPGDFFDWHVDTTPGDGTGRTLNANVMLSDPLLDFEGGRFKVGATTLRLSQGDLYIYPASYPHVVEDVTAGRRRTLVVGVVDPQAVVEPDAHKRLLAYDWQGLRGLGGRQLYAEPLRAPYWRAATANLDALAAEEPILFGAEPKLRLIHERHTAAMGRPAASDTGPHGWGLYDTAPPLSHRRAPGTAPPGTARHLAPGCP